MQPDDMLLMEISFPSSENRDNTLEKKTENAFTL